MEQDETKNNGQSNTDDQKLNFQKLYHDPMVQKILANNFQPGNIQLTQRLGETLGLDKDSLVLVHTSSVSDPGSPAVTLAKWFQCKVTGIVKNENNLEKAEELANRYGLTDRIGFQVSGSHKINISDRTFDAVVYEGALGESKNLQDKELMVAEMYRLLKNGGKIGISNVIIDGELPNELAAVLSQIPAVSGALSYKSYYDLLATAGFRNIKFESHDQAVKVMFDKAKGLLSGAAFFINLCNIDLEKSFGITLEQANTLLDIGYAELEKGTIGYGSFIAEK
jgi:hypothetical protein